MGAKLLTGFQRVRTRFFFFFPSHLDLPDLNLEGGKVLEDLQVLRLVLEGVEVALDGLGVVALRAVQEAVDVPAYVTAPREKKTAKAKNTKNTKNTKQKTEK